MKKYLWGRYFSTVIISLAGSLSVFMVYMWDAQRKLSTDLIIEYPVSTWDTFLFLSKPFLILIPLVALFMVSGAYFISKQWGSEIVITTTIEEKSGIIQRETKVKFMSDNERDLFKIILDTEGEVYQNDLTRKSGLEKYQVSRILQRFESYGLLHKERHGMTNQIYLTTVHPSMD